MAITEKEHMESIRKSQYPWMDDDQFECFQMLSDLVYGAHHILGKIRPCGTGIEINTRNHGWASFDFNGLTRAIVMAHDRMIRFEIDPSGPGMLKLCFHRRKMREGRMFERHPTLEDAVKTIRANQ